MKDIENMAPGGSQSPSQSPEEAQWNARVDLAAAHRICFNEGFSEGIFNHLTARVPGHDDRYYQIPFGTHWSEVTASTFMEVSWDGQILKGDGPLERSGFGIHAPLHQKIPTAEAVFHTHMPFATALTRLEDQTIKPIGQTELSMMRKIVYDAHYTGPADDRAEGERMVDLFDANPGKSIVFMANHGILTIGSIAEAYNQLYYIERIAQVQLYAMWTNQPLHYLPQEVIEESYRIWKSGAQYGDKTTEQHHFDALKRRLDRTEPDYKS
jgi:ribulose-5-phosphate 4-epimerase/fuculose-1-phosphate aldolase